MCARKNPKKFPLFLFRRIFVTRMHALLIMLPHSIIVDDALNKASTEMNKKMQPCMAMAGKKKTRSVRVTRER